MKKMLKILVVLTSLTSYSNEFNMTDGLQNAGYLHR